MSKISLVLTWVVVCLLTPASHARDVLFYQTSKNYHLEGREGEVFRRQFESRMFSHADWLGRLVIIFDEPEFDQTLEVYAKPDGSRWLSYVRATPALSLLLTPTLPGEHYDTAKDLAVVRYIRREIALPADVADQIEQFWHIIMPGSRRKPEPPAGRVNLRLILFVAFLRDHGSIQAGEIPLPAIDTPAYHSFVEIVEDLMKACNGGQKDRILARLPSKIQHLRALLKRD